MTDPSGERQSPDDSDVVVPMELYKIVTVFSTLIAAALVVAGFVILDAATRSAQAPVEEVNVGLAVVGVAVILIGSAIYVFSTRFRTEGMGNAKDEAD